MVIKDWHGRRCSQRGSSVCTLIGCGWASQGLLSFKCVLFFEAGKQNVPSFLCWMFTIQWPPSGGAGQGHVDPVEKYFPTHLFLSALNSRHIMSILGQQSGKDQSEPKWTYGLVILFHFLVFRLHTYWSGFYPFKTQMAQGTNIDNYRHLIPRSNKFHIYKLSSC